MIYISGRITKNKNWKKDFEEAEKYLESTGQTIIINPLKLDEQTKKLFGTDTPTYEQYMKWDIHELIVCNSIYMLRGWWRSKGARLERRIAKVLGLKIIYQKRGEK